MPLTYTDTYLDCRGVFSVTPFELVGDGRRLFFNVPNGTLRKEIYTVIDGELNETPFRNGARMETPIRGLERLLPMPHESFAVVVDRGEFPLGSISLTNLKPVPVIFDDGQRACITLTGTLQASACITDPCMLVKEYLNTGMQSPEATITNTLRNSLIRKCPAVIGDALRRVAPHDALGMMDTISLDLAQEAVAHAESKLGWVQITSCYLDLQVVNVDEIVRMSNTVYEDRRRMKDKLATALLDTYGQSPIPGEMVQLMVSYVQTHPNEDGGKLLNLCTELKNLCQLHSPATLLQHSQQLGLLGGP